MVSYSHNKTSSTSSAESNQSEAKSAKYRGVRKRNWGKWVAEIRLPNSRERIWLGSYDSAEKAARAFDAALFCLRGPNAKFNLPNCPPDIPGGKSLSRTQIQSAAAEFANQLSQSSYSSPFSCSQSQQTTRTTTTTTFDELLDCSSSSVSGTESLLFSDMFVSCPDLDVSVSDYGFFDEPVFGNYGCYQYDQYQSQVAQEVNCCYDVEDYPQLWNF